MHPKVAVAGVSGAAVTLLEWAASLVHVNLPDPVAAAIVVLVMSAAGYLTPARK